VFFQNHIEMVETLKTNLNICTIAEIPINKLTPTIKIASLGYGGCSASCQAVGVCWVAIPHFEP